MKCAYIGTRCEELLTQLMGTSRLLSQGLKKLNFVSNQALLYGHDVATEPFVMRTSTSNDDIESVVPGIDLFIFSTTTYDGLGQQMLGLPQICKVQVCDGECINRTFMPAEFLEMDTSSGSCRVELPSVCPLGKESVSVLVSLQSYASISTLRHFTCLPCGRGQQKHVDTKGTWSCQFCREDQYILDPNDEDFTCQDCPLGALCDGHTLIGLVPGSTWLPNLGLGIYELVSCPPGYEGVFFEKSNVTLLHTNQQCSLCPSLYFCSGGVDLRTACPEGMYAQPGSKSMESCRPAEFLQMVTSFPLSKKEFSSKESRFRSALASSLLIPEDRVIIVRVTRLDNQTADAIRVDSEVAIDNYDEATQLKQTFQAELLNNKLFLNGLPGCSVVAVTIKSQRVQSDNFSSYLILIVCVVSLALTILATFAYQYVYKRGYEDHDVLIRTKTLRRRLRIELQDGFALYNERIPFWKRQDNFLFIFKACIDSAVNLDLFREFDLEHFDAFCLGLEYYSQITPDRIVQFDATCEWILEIASHLINPKQNQYQDQRCWNFTTEQERHAYLSKLCKAQIWNSKRRNLFLELKGIAEEFMGQIALSCDDRFQILCSEPCGPELVQLASWPNASETAGYQPQDFGRSPSSGPPWLPRRQDDIQVENLFLLFSILNTYSS